VTSIALDSDGRVLIAGDFASVNGLRRSGLVRLNGDPALRFMPPDRVAQGLFQFSVVTMPGRTNLLQSSIDLLNWSDVITNRSESYTIEFEDPDPTLPQRFYRIISP
jgi:hypothetical protein